MGNHNYIGIVEPGLNTENSTHEQEFWCMYFRFSITLVSWNLGYAWKILSSADSVISLVVLIIPMFQSANIQGASFHVHHEQQYGENACE